MTGIDRDLERRVHRALSSLPSLRAPASLLPRVMALVTRPWYARAWLTWPVAAQAASVVLFLAVVAGVASGFMASEQFLSVAALARVAWRWLVAPLAVYFFVMAVALSVVTAASWAALNRVALGGLAE